MEYETLLEKAPTHGTRSRLTDELRNMPVDSDKCLLVEPSIAAALKQHGYRKGWKVVTKKAGPSVKFWRVE